MLNYPYILPNSQSSTSFIKKLGYLFLVGFGLALVGLFLNNNFIPVYADKCTSKYTDLDELANCYKNEISSVSSQLSKIREKKTSINGTISGLSTKLSVTQAEMDDLNKQIKDLQADLAVISKNLLDRKGSFEEKNKMRNIVLRNFSKRSNMNGVEIFLANPQDSNLNGFEYSAYSYSINKSLSEEALKWMSILTAEIESYEKDKADAESLKGELEDSVASLVAMKKSLDAQKKNAESELTDLNAKEKDYSQRLSELSSKQQDILAQKSGGDTVISGYEGASYTLKSPHFSSRPAFVVMSYGAYTHRYGLSQYGAKARADSGQSTEDIIKFYYNQKPTTVKDLDKKDICVDGQGDMQFNEYLYGLGEMPPSWHKEALKAQAIAARSYAYRYIKKDKCICTTTSCQYFDESLVDRSDRKAWRDAVDATAGQIIGGSMDATGYGWYSSTTGGYITSIGKWDTSGSWPADSYEKKAKSPWFDKAWYTKSYRDDSGTCGRESPWMTEAEMADILNSWVVWRKGSSSEKDKITTAVNNCFGENPASMDKMAELAAKYNEEYTSISGVSVSIDSGKTTQVVFQTNRGKTTVSGNEFTTIFNMRAPGYISIRSTINGSNGLYHIEVKN